jgi:sigma54-dependent transcription regulator
MDVRPETELIRTIVAAMLASDAFKRSGLNRDLLQYLADAKMRNDASRINEYTIAQDIFQRDDTFDPGTDPIVRVRMRRLRDAIARYNATLEEDSPRLSLPTGRYVLDLSVQSPPPERLKAPKHPVQRHLDPRPFPGCASRRA